MVPKRFGDFLEYREVNGTPGTPIVIRYPSELIRCSNNIVQYIIIYVSTISRLLVMSMILSGTPNNLRYIKTHKLIIPIVIER